MIDETPAIKALHDRYCDLSGIPLPFSIERHYVWQAWMAKGFKAEDLELVIRHIRNLSKKGRPAPSLSFRNLISRPEFFEEIWAEAKALARVHQPDPARQSVLAAVGRTEPQPDNTKRAGDIANAAIAEGYRKLKESLK